MSKQEEQEAEIESMRTQLHRLVMSKAGNLIDKEVGDLSTQLDELIVKYQKAKNKSAR